MKKFFFVFVFIIPLFVSCGGAGPDDSSQKQSVEDNARRKAAYNRIRGVYRGLLETREPLAIPLEIELVLYTYDIIEAEPDPNGDPVIRTVLLGQFRAINTVGEIDDINLATAYDTKTGSITLNNNALLSSTACPMGPHDPISIQGSLLNNEFNGTIRRTASTWGSLKLKQSGEIVAEPILDQKQRLERFLSPLVGEYRGPFTSTNGREDFPVQIDFRIEYVKMNFGSDFVYCPDLRGSYIRPDLGANIGTLVVRGIYRHSENNLQIESIVNSLAAASPPSRDFSLLAVPGSNNLDIHATVDRTMHENGSFTVHGFRGDMNWWTSKGNITTKKVK